MKLCATLLLLAVGFAPVLTGQTALTNGDIVKLAKSGLSDDFIINLIEQQPSKLSTDVGRLVELKTSGVSERVVTAAVRKTPPSEPVTSDGVIRLVKAGFSDDFVVDMLNRQSTGFTTDATRLVELRQAGVSERVLAAMVSKAATKELPAGTEITIRLIDSIDSEKSNVGDEFRASLDEPLMLGDQAVAPKGADAVVKLVAAKESGKLTGRTELTIELAAVTIDGREVPITTSSVSQASGSRGARTAKTAAVTGAVGAVIGAIAGGGKGAAIGAGAGAAAGAGSQVFMKGQRVQIPSETLLIFTTQDPVKF